MESRDDFWGVFAFPWKPANRARYAVAIFLLPLLIVALIQMIYTIQGRTLAPVVWLGAAALGIVLGALFTLQYIYIAKRLNCRAPASASAGLESDCIVVSGFVQSPGVARLEDSHLVLIPLVGQEVSVPLAEISSVRVRHYFNGNQYWGDNAFFQLDVTGRRARLGFGVSHPGAWEQALRAKG